MFKVGKAQPEINKKLLSFPLKDLFNYVDGKLFWKSHQELKLVRDNCYYIDTGAVHWGTLTILNLENI